MTRHIHYRVLNRAGEVVFQSDDVNAAKDFYATNPRPLDSGYRLQEVGVNEDGSNAVALDLNHAFDPKRAQAVERRFVERHGDKPADVKASLLAGVYEGNVETQEHAGDAELATAYGEQTENIPEDPIDPDSSRYGSGVASA